MAFVNGHCKTNGNRKLTALELEGNSGVEGCNDSLGTYTLSPMLLPEITLPSKTYLPILVIIKCVPLHKPAVMSKFLSSITGTLYPLPVLPHGSYMVKYLAIYYNMSHRIITYYDKTIHNLMKYEWVLM